MGRLSVQSARVLNALEGDDDAALLIRCDGKLAAVLVRLGEIHGEEEGWWYLEAGFGACAARPPAFRHLASALRWVGRCCRLGGEEVESACLELLPSA